MNINGSDHQMVGQSGKRKLMLSKQVAELQL